MSRRDPGRFLTPVVWLAAIAFGGLLPAVSARDAGALGYHDITPTGAAFPAWDGGDTGLCFADIDADGHVDLLSIGDHGSPFVNTTQHGIMVYFGDGAGGWSIHMEGDFGYGGIAVGDVDGDGRLDVGYGMHHNYSGNDLGDQLIEVALGDGTGTVWTPWDDGLAQNGETWGMFATRFADFDADGDLDLVSLSFGSGNGLHVYRNDGDGTWTQTWARTGGNASSQLAVGDVNGDGLPDIAAAYQFGTVWLGDGAQFTQADQGLPSAGTFGRLGIDLGDVDSDGRADLSFVLGGGVHVYLWRDDHWEPTTGLPSTGIYELTKLWDLDSDGFLDVIALGEGVASVWLGDGAGGWTASGGFVAAGASDTGAIEVGGDVDHNGRSDVAFVQREGSWPNDHNRLHVFSEDSIPTARWIMGQAPRIHQTVRNGSVQAVRWSSAHFGGEPATVDLEMSTSGAGGPWTILAAGLPDGGQWQWRVATLPSSQAFLRWTLHQAGTVASGVSGPFTIAGEGPASVPEPIADGRLVVLSNPVTDRARFLWAPPAASPGSHGSRGSDGPGMSDAPDAVLPTSDVLRLFRADGALIRTIPLPAAGPAATGGSVTWDLNDGHGVPVPNGCYWARIETGSTEGPAAVRHRTVGVVVARR
ncbi:MAG: VCBS repeat-containing protein [Candidatus Eisenbacteria bacterium]